MPLKQLFHTTSTFLLCRIFEDLWWEPVVGHGNDLTWLNVLQEKSIPRVTGSNGKIASTLGLFYLFILYHICCLPGNAITEKKNVYKQAHDEFFPLGR